MRLVRGILICFKFETQLECRVILYLSSKLNEMFKSTEFSVVKMNSGETVTEV